MVDAEAETTFAPAIWWRLLHKSANSGAGSGAGLRPGGAHPGVAAMLRASGAPVAGPGRSSVRAGAGGTAAGVALDHVARGQRAGPDRPLRGGAGRCRARRRADPA